MVVWHWIPDRVRDDRLDNRDDRLDDRNDKLDGWDDKLDGWDDKSDDSDDKLDDRDDKTEGRGTFAACPTKLILGMVLSLHPSLSLLACLSLRA